MMQKLLYATDFSENATKAFEFALKITHQYDAELTMMHVFALPHASMDYPSSFNVREMRSQAINDFQKSLKELFEGFNRETSKKAKVDFRAVENSSTTEGIIEVANGIDPDLIIIGTKGGNKIKTLIFGSTAKSLIARSPSPVLAVPENAVYQEFARILFAIDFCEEDLTALSHWVGAFQPSSPEFTLIHIDTQIDKPGDDKMEEFKKLVEKNIGYQKIKFHLLFADTLRDYDSLNLFLQRNEFDLLLMYVKPREGFMDNLFHHDMVKKMESRTPVPLLSYNKFCVDKWKASAIH
jgi:nucleotide-binding universal stress UspA family protein